MIKLGKVFLVVLIFVIQCQAQSSPQKCSQLSFLPQPKQIFCNLANPSPRVLENPCRILYRIQGNQQHKDYGYMVQLIEHQQQKTFSCQISHVMIGKYDSYKATGFEYEVQIELLDYTLRSAFKTIEEAYEIHIDVNMTQIKAATYVGFVRGLQTFMQSIICQKWKLKNCKIPYLPIQIKDQPAFQYRSIMIDTARHYLPKTQIYETIDALMYNKMSIMHWHIVDEDSFPLKLDSHPEIAEYGAFSPEEIYTPEDVRSIVRYAMVRGVRVVPELDTPGHAASWGLAPQNQGISCRFGNFGYMGPLDVTLEATYKLVKQVFTEIFQLFPDPFVHLGGDQVSLTCQQNKTQFSKAYSSDIQIVYRKRQRKMLKQLNPQKRFIYWMNSMNIELQGDDIIHWWGSTYFPKTNYQLIISIYGPFYLDLGYGNYFANSYGTYNTWRDMYENDIGKMASESASKVIGAQAALWSQISNKYVHHLKIWIRSSSLAERTWSILGQNARPQFFRRIVMHERLMNRRGIPTAPATSEQCERNVDLCST